MEEYDANEEISPPPHCVVSEVKIIIINVCCEKTLERREFIFYLSL
jgi:hypothetical protein